KNPIILLLLILFLSSAGHAQQSKDDQIQIPNRSNSKAQEQKPYVILISIDGFRHDYFDKFNTGFLNKMRQKGVQAKYMIPSYPSVTFPNHYTIVTGMIPPHHGVVGNQMYNPDTDEWYSIRDHKAVTKANW